MCSSDSYRSHTRIMNIKLATLLALAAAASAARPNYNFRYDVRDSDSRNDYGHQETRNLENTEGTYSVQLPDGRLQQVNYRVNGDSGYLAEVSYKGEARFPGSDESFESFESREFGRPSFESLESRERRVFAAPRGRPSSRPSRGPFSRQSTESFEFPFASRESRENRFDSPESHEFFKAARNPFIRADSDEYRYG